MASTFILLPWFGSLCALILFYKLFSKSKYLSSKQPFPPGPPGLPLVGNIFDLGEVPHQTFYNLQSKYGPILWIKLGAINTLVINSADAASELFRKCDLSFADRKVSDSLTALGYNRGSVAVGTYGDYWRKLRRICTTEFLVHKKVNASVPMREQSIRKMIEEIKNGGTREIRIDRFLFSNAFSIIGNLMLSEKVMEKKVDKASEFFDAFRLYLEWIGKPNLSDFMPYLKWMDLQGIKRNSAKYLERLLGFAAGIVEERIKERNMGKERESRDLLDALLDEGDFSAEGDEKLSVKNITIVLLEMFFGGTETTSGTIEWGMAELLCHENCMKKIQEELDQVVGRTRIVEENDLPNLPYLQAVVKEILRLHPPLQMLLPRNSMEDTEFMGYFVPKNTQIFVNAWAIHRDPAAWPDPFSFKPERFLDSDIDFKGQHFEMIPFGSGRRSCLGLTLGHRMVSLALASLLQAFDWKLGNGLEPETLDMREMVGLTLRKLVPLKVIPIPRE